MISSELLFVLNVIGIYCASSSVKIGTQNFCAFEKNVLNVLAVEYMEAAFNSHQFYMSIGFVEMLHVGPH